INWDSVVNYVIIPATQTLSAGAPVNPTITSVFISTIAVSWTTVPNTTGYEIDASTAANFTGTIFSSVTANTSATTLTVGTASPLSANTTYYVRAGALYSGSTAYANTTPASTSTLTNDITGAQVSQVQSGQITVDWVSLGANGSEGYS